MFVSFGFSVFTKKNLVNNVRKSPCTLQCSRCLGRFKDNLSILFDHKKFTLVSCFRNNLYIFWETYQHKLPGKQIMPNSSRLLIFLKQDCSVCEPCWHPDPVPEGCFSTLMLKGLEPNPFMLDVLEFESAENTKKTCLFSKAGSNFVKQRSKTEFSDEVVFLTSGVGFGQTA